MRNRKPTKKFNMQPGDAANYEAGAESYFESLRRPFEQTLEATKKNRPKVVIRIMLILVVITILVLPFCWTWIVMFVFHQNTYTLSGKPHPITETAGFIVFWCLIGAGVVGMFVQGVMREYELKSAAKPLSAPAMVFALSYTILRELESFERSNLPHHRQTIMELWAKLLTYLRWALQGSISSEAAHFHGLPASDYRVASQAENIANALNWNEVRRTEYDVIAALNNLHSKVSPRLQRSEDYRRDLPRLKTMFRGMGNFFYTTIVKSRFDNVGQASWGYDELVGAAKIVNNLSPIMAESPRRAHLLSAKVFTHANLAIAFLAWWIVFQTLFVVLIFAAFRLLPALSMNSQAIVGLIAAPIAAAISMVGISRRST